MSADPASPALDPFDALERVHDRQTFLEFVEALIADREAAVALEAGDPEQYRWSGALSWENGTIERFLESALRCLRDNEHRDDYLRELSWKGFAVFLYGGKIYE